MVYFCTRANIDSFFFSYYYLITSFHPPKYKSIKILSNAEITITLKFISHKISFISSTAIESVVPREDATVKELTLILREWFVIWKDLYKVWK